MLTYRRLPDDEWHKLTPMFEDKGLAVPHPALAEIIVAEDSDRIVGFLTKQLVAHVEPLWIAPEYRGRVHDRVDWFHMSEMMVQTPAYVFADSPARERQCMRGGMRQVKSADGFPYTVWFRDKQGRQTAGHE